MVDEDRDSSRDGGEERKDDVQDASEERKHEMAERTEETLSAVREDLGNQKYPVTSEELATAYADRPLDLPNETESLGSVFDRVDQSEFEDAEQAFEAVATEFDTGDHLEDRRKTADGAAEWEDGRAAATQDAEIAEHLEPEEGTIRESHRQASEAQAEKHDEDDSGNSE